MYEQERGVRLAGQEDDLGGLAGLQARPRKNAPAAGTLESFGPCVDRSAHPKRVRGSNGGRTLTAGQMHELRGTGGRSTEGTDCKGATDPDPYIGHDADRFRHSWGRASETGDLRGADLGGSGRTVAGEQCAD